MRYSADPSNQGFSPNPGPRPDGNNQGFSPNGGNQGFSPNSGSNNQGFSSWFYLHGNLRNQQTNLTLLYIKFIICKARTIQYGRIRSIETLIGSKVQVLHTVTGPKLWAWWVYIYLFMLAKKWNKSAFNVKLYIYIFAS